MSILGLIIALVILGVVYYLVMTLPIAEPFKTIIQVVVILAAILFLLGMVFPLFDGRPLVLRL